MAHSHLLVQHLLKQLDKHAAERDSRERRPAWLVELVQRVAEQFQPLAGVGRVGYECEPAATGEWEARFYLGTTEVVGGKDDGQWRAASFELNLQGLTHCFSQIDEFHWNVAASQAAGSSSFLSLRGQADGHPVHVKAYSRAPAHAGPGLRQYGDGSVQPV